MIPISEQPGAFIKTLEEEKGQVIFQPWADIRAVKFPSYSGQSEGGAQIKPGHQQYTVHILDCTLPAAEHQAQWVPSIAQNPSIINEEIN
jgi:hypothetical protein